VPTSIRCQRCTKLLRVPDAFVGKQIKCPGCGHSFAAQPPEEELPSVVEIDEEPESQQQAESAPSAAATAWKVVLPKKAKGRPASESVRAPAMALMMVGGLALVLSIANLAFLSTGRGPFARPVPTESAQTLRRDEAAYAREQAFNRVYAIGVTAVVISSVLWGIVVPLGGYFMYKLSSWSTVMFAAIVAMLPGHPFCLFGMPFGIWALVVISRPEVKAAFKS
jgi:phage FluMu protein Com